MKRRMGKETRLRRLVGFLVVYVVERILHNACQRQTLPGCTGKDVVSGEEDILRTLANVERR
jgi:hypothetical protein